jgi:hypothetical protein
MCYIPVNKFSLVALIMFHPVNCKINLALESLSCNVLTQLQLLLVQGNENEIRNLKRQVYHSLSHGCIIVF